MNGLIGDNQTKKKSYQDLGQHYDDFELYEIQEQNFYEERDRAAQDDTHLMDLSVTKDAAMLQDHLRTQSHCMNESASGINFGQMHKKMQSLESSYKALENNLSREDATAATLHNMIEKLTKEKVRSLTATLSAYLD